MVTDGPNRFDPGGSVVLDLADVNLLVIQLLVTSVRNVRRMLEELRGGGYNLDRFKLLCNRVGLDSAHLEVDHVEQTLKRKIAFQVPDDWRSVSASINMGVPLKGLAPKSRVRQAIHEIAEQIVRGVDTETESGDARKNSILGRIFSPS